MTSNQTTISIVLPSFKGADILAKQLPGFIQYLQKQKIAYEIIIVDDGSEDNQATKKVSEQLECQFIAFDKNKGKGAAVRAGVFKAKGDYIIFTDIDIPFAFDAFPNFIDALVKYNYDLVVGDRTLPESTYFTKISWLRKFGSDFFSAIVSRAFTDGLNDTQCGMKAFNKKVALDLFSVGMVEGFAFDVELISIAVKRKYKRKRLPVQFRCNDSKSVKVVAHGAGMLIDLVKIAWRHRTGKYKLNQS